MQTCNRIYVFTLAVMFVSFIGTDPAGGAAAELLNRARRAAQEDRHSEAIDLYLQAIREKPSLESSVAFELGEQYTWAEKPDSAIAWYKRCLAHHPGNIDAELGIARALSWADRLDESLAAYKDLLPRSKGREEDVRLGIARVTSWQDNLDTSEGLYRDILRDYPSSTEARLGFAQVTNWSGRHRKAAAMYREILEEEPENKDALEGLARAEAWGGRPDVALSTIDAAGRSGSLDRVAREIEGGWSPGGSETFSRRKDSDDIDIRMLTSTIGYSPTPLTRVGLSFSRGEITQSGFPDITRDEFVLQLYRRFSASLSVTANPGFQWNRFESSVFPPNPNLFDNAMFFIYDVYATITPRDWVRIDVGSSREILDIPLSISKKITLTGGSVGFDWRLSYRLTTFSNVKFYDFSDGNFKFIVTQRVEWLSPLRIRYPYPNRFTFYTGYEFFDFTKQLDNGYFNPNTYFNWLLGSRFQTTIRERVSFLFDGRLGFEKDTESDWLAIGAFLAGVRINPAGRFYIGAGYEKSNSRLGTAAGYRSTGFYVTAEYAFAR